LHDRTAFQRVALEFDYEQPTDPVLENQVSPANGGCRLALELPQRFIEELLGVLPQQVLHLTLDHWPISSFREATARAN
jgi:hypothetical protein